jgi:hypothetical protein
MKTFWAFMRYVLRKPNETSESSGGSVVGISDPCPDTCLRLPNIFL